MTERERFIKTLKREKIGGRVPTFELVFFLTVESLGRIHPTHMSFYQWDQMSSSEKKAIIDYNAETLIMTAEKYHHSAIFVHPNPGGTEGLIRLLEAIREKSGDKYFLLTHGDPTFYIPDGNGMMDFSIRMYEDAAGLKKEAEQNLSNYLQLAEEVDRRGHLLDGFGLCSDYCFNVNPFFSPDMFDEFIGPYLARVCDEYRSMGFYTIKHTDGNIMPIIDRIVDCRPDALHSIDPQGGVSLDTVIKKYGDRVAVCGNVNCGLLQTGTTEECISDVKRSLREGMQNGGGYVFCTSNCAYTGLPLERYELMNNIWYNEGIYAD